MRVNGGSGCGTLDSVFERLGLVMCSRLRTTGNSLRVEGSSKQEALPSSADLRLELLAQCGRTLAELGESHRLHGHKGPRAKK